MRSVWVAKLQHQVLQGGPQHCTQRGGGGRGGDERGGERGREEKRGGEEVRGESTDNNSNKIQSTACTCMLSETAQNKSYFSHMRVVHLYGAFNLDCTLLIQLHVNGLIPL